MTAILRDASGKMHHGILFDPPLVVKYLTVTSSAFPGTDTPCYGIHGWGFARKGNARAIRHTVNIALEEMYPNGQNPSLRQQPFLLALRR